MCAQKLKNSSKLLGILSQSTEEWFKFRKELNQSQSFEIYMTEKEIEELILERKTAKDSKDYSKADQIREKLLKIPKILEEFFNF